MNGRTSGRERADQTYPTESGRRHPSAPATEDPAAKRANTPETAETGAFNLQHRPEDRPDMAHRTGGRDVDPTASREPTVEAPHAGHEPAAPASGEAEEERMTTGEGPQPQHGQASNDAGGIEGAQPGEDTAIRDEKQLIADSQAEFPSADRTFEWRGGTAMPKETTGDLYYTPQEAPPDRKGRGGKRRAVVVTAMAAGIGLIALTRMRRRP
ncbi:MAG: hypothetical protein IVW36_07255 [Dehalococcoidia bacterium]|nr:hypothetical protein [Dehalococcoidia bacterium]